MAELGDFITQGPKSQKEVTVEMMDYDYVNKCKDPAELRAILARLKSGEEGHFPHLNHHVEERLLSLLPDKERRKIKNLRAGPRPEEVSEAEALLGEWMRSVRQEDEHLNRQAKENSSGNARDRPLPPVRGRKGVPSVSSGTPSNPDPEPEVPIIEDVELPKRPAAHVYDAPEYFRKWDKFDAEAEEKRVDDAEAKRMAASDAARHAYDEKERGRARRRELELAELRGRMQWASMSSLERTRMALHEKNKGNECYKAGEPEEAMSFYSRALALLDETHPETVKCWANRAMAALKLGLLEKAEDDCSQALVLDPSYHKARLRRAMTRHRRGRYDGAISDFEVLIREAPDMPDVAKLAERSRQKQREVEGERMAAQGQETGIQEVGERQSVAVVDGRPPVLDDAVWERRLVGSQADVVGVGGGGFKRITIIEDGSDEEDEEQEGERPAAGGFSRIQITEEDSDEEGEEEVGVKAETSRMTQVPITVEDAEEGEREDSDDDVDGGPQQSREQTSSGSVRIPIAEEDEVENEGMSEWEAQQLKESGVQLFMSARYPEAKTHFQRALEGVEAAARASGKPVDDSSLWNNLHNNLSACALAEEDWEGVLRHTSAVLSCQPNNFKALIRRGEVHDRMGNLTAALSDLRKAVGIDPSATQVADKISAIEAKLNEGQGVEGTSTTPKGESARLVASAEEAMVDRRHEEACHLLSDALALYPRNTHARRNRMRCSLILGRFQDAERDATQLLKGQPDDGEALESRARARQGLGNLAGATADVRAALVGNPANGALRSLLTALSSAKSPAAGTTQDESAVRQAEAQEAKDKGNLAMKAGNLDAAEGWYRKAVELDPALLAARNNLAACLLKAGKWNESVQAAALVLEQDPLNVKALFRRAQAHIQLGKYAAAQRDLEQVLAAEPKNGPALETLAAVRRAKQEGGSSGSEDMGAVSEVVPDAPRAAQSSTSVRVQIVEDDEDDEEAVEEAEGQDQGHAEDRSSAHAVPKPASGATVVRVPIFAEDNEDDEEEASESPAQQRARSDEEKDRGNQALKAGDLTAACEAYTRALDVDPSNSAARNNRALAFLRLGKSLEARDDASAVLAEDPENCKALYRRAQAKEELGDRVGAVADLREVLRVEPSNKPALHKLDQAEKALALEQAKFKKKQQQLQTTGQTVPSGTSGIREVSSRPRTASAQVTQSSPAPTTPPASSPVHSTGGSPRSRTQPAAVAAAAPSVSGAPAASPPRALPKVRAKVPTAPPKTMLELEKVWRELKKEPADLAEYLCTFKASTFKKVFKESVNPDIVPSLLAVTQHHLAAPDQAPGAAVKILRGLTRIPGFSMTLMLLAEEDKTAVRAACDLLEQTPKHTADAAEIRREFQA